MREDYKERAKLFGEVMTAITDGMSIVFTPDNVDAGDDFLIFSASDSIKVTFHKNRVPFWIEFKGDEPMRLEDCPTSFFRSILKNIK